MNTFWQDIRYGLRVMRQNPGFIVVAVFALALGVGANTAIFSVVNAILLNPINYENLDQLVMVWEKSAKRGFGQIPTSLPNFTDLRNDNKSLTDLGAFTDSNFNLTGGEQPERVIGVRVTATLLSVVGVKPLHGRLFVAGEDEPQANRVLILSNQLWQRSFGANPNIVGQNVAINGNSYTVVGIMPSDFKFPPAFSATVASSQYAMPNADLWVPLVPEELLKARDIRALFMIGRLKPGVTPEAAQSEMNVIASRLQKEYPEVDADMEVDVVPLRQQITGDIRLALLVLFGAVGCVLLIACANVANLLLAKASGRQKEVAIRTALGATRLRIIRQLLTEGMLLGLAGGLLGSLLAILVLRQLVIFSPANVSIPDNIGIDWKVLTFTLLLSLFTSFVFGLAPALQASKLDLNETLKEGGRGNSGGSKANYLRSLLVVTEIALALVLLIASGLMIKSFLRLQNVDPGFNPENLITLEMQLPETKYTDKDRQAIFQQQLVQRVAQVPGVRSVGTVDNLPFSGNELNLAWGIEGQPPLSAADRPRAFLRKVSPNYFESMGIPVRNGRAFTDSDNGNAPGVAVVNETAARRFWPNQEPLGKRFKRGTIDSQRPWMTVIGVVAPVSHTALQVASQPEVYLAFQQNPGLNLTLVARTTSDPKAFAGAVRREVSALDKDLPVSNMKFMDEIIGKSVAQPRVYALLLGIFAGLALILASIGIYGVMSYSVTQRIHEIGIRMALGARPVDVLKLVVKQGLALALVGVFVGLIVSVALTRVLASQLYGVTPTDPVTFTAISVLLILVAVIACSIPAIRATKVDPMIAVRYE
ncbi:MAG TPA: ABC transporter permease [Pyrinomonadaceae bacterium]|nr:ABC transporter permease [Pyrinomonadaceae bacterium]